VLFTIMCVRKFCDFSYVLFTISLEKLSYTHDDRILFIERLFQWAIGRAR